MTYYLQSLKLLQDFKVKKTNLRCFTEGKVIMGIFDSDDESKVSNWINENRLNDKSVFMTFNNPVAQTNQKNFSDNQIGTRNFILVDLDPNKGIANSSSTDDEKKKAETLKDKVKENLEDEGIKNIIEADSGNGYHLLIPITPIIAAETTKETKLFLDILSSKFSTEAVAVDTTVYNPSRLTKLYGSMATKGENTKERPHRRSSILTKAWSSATNDFELIRKIIKKHEQSNVNDKSEKKVSQTSNTLKTYKRAYAEIWLQHYNLEYEKKSGNVPGLTLYVLKRCPLRDHSNNDRGATLQETFDHKVRFSCLHESHNTISIDDFCMKYPIPAEAEISWNTDYFDRKGAFNVGRYFISARGIEMKIKEESIIISAPIFISEIRRVVSTNEADYLLNYFVNGEWLSKWIPSSTLQINEFRKLVTYSVPVPPRNEANLLDFLTLQKDQISVSYLHKSVGWQDEEVYLLNDSLTKDNRHKSKMANDSVFDLTPSGNYKKWKQMIETEVLGTDMELGLAIGFSAIVIGYLAKINPELGSLVVSLEGHSTTGKSTAQAMAAGLYGNVASLHDPWNSTWNSILKKLDNNHGIVYTLDELGGSLQKDFSSIIYQLSSGKARMRLNSSSELVKQATFATTIVSSSEIAMRSRLPNLAGLAVRVIAFQEIQWTKSGASAEKIKKVSFENRGTAAKVFVEKLLAAGHHNLIQRHYEQSKQDLFLELADTPYKDRLMTSYGILLCTAKLIIELLKLPLDINRLKELLAVSANLSGGSSVKEEISDKEVLARIFISNYRRLKAGSESYVNSQAIMGKYALVGGEIKVNFFKKDFEDALKKELESEDLTWQIRKMVKDGLLHAEAGRNTKRVKIDSQSFTTYEFLLSKDILGWLEQNVGSYPISQKPKNIARDLKELEDVTIEETF